MIYPMKCSSHFTVNLRMMILEFMFLIHKTRFPSLSVLLSWDLRYSSAALHGPTHSITMIYMFRHETTAAATIVNTASYQTDLVFSTRRVEATTYVISGITRESANPCMQRRHDMLYNDD